MQLLPGQRKQQSYWFGVYTSNIYSVRNLLRRQLQRIPIVWDSSWLTHWSWKKLMSPWTWSQRNTSMLSLKDLPDTSLGLEPDHIFITWGGQSKDNKIFWNRGCLDLSGSKRTHAWIARKAAMQVQFPIKHKTPRFHLPIPLRKLDTKCPDPDASGCLISPWPKNSTSVSPNKAGPRNKTINTAPATQTSVPPTLAWPSSLNKFNLSVLHQHIENGKRRHRWFSHLARVKRETDQSNIYPIMRAKMKVKTGIEGWMAAA